MQFESWADVIAMGGYGFFVWLSYGVSIIATLALIIVFKLEQRALTRAVVAQSARQLRIKQAQEKQRES